MLTHLTCAVLQTTPPHSWEAGLALRLGIPAGSTVREDPHLPEVFYLESSIEATDGTSALELAAKAAAAVTAVVGLGLVVDELVALGPDGATRWSADDVVVDSTVTPTI